MFREAQDQQSKMQQSVYAELEDHMQYLKKTATSWFNNDSASVGKRQQTLQKAAALCKRLASFDDENSDYLHAMSDDFYSQSSSLMGILSAVQEEEYIADHNAPIFSSRGLNDESKTGAVNTNDWHLFMATEPSLFVEANSYVAENPEEMRVRAFNYMDDTTSGHGMTRTTKMNLTEQFLSRVESARQDFEKEHSSIGKRQASTVSFPDAAIFF